MSPEEVLDDEAGPLAHVPVEPTLVHDSDRESREESSRTPMDSKVERLYKETIIKRRHEQGEASGTAPMAYAQVDRIVAAITSTTSVAEATSY